MTEKTDVTKELIKLRQIIKDLQKEIESHNKSNWHDPIVISTIVIAIATFVNMGVSYFMLGTTRDYTKVTRDIYKAANRPYVGIANIPVDIDAKHHVLLYKLEMKNFGSIPANSFEVDWSAYLNGKKIKQYDKMNTQAVLMPQTSNYVHGMIGSDNLPSLINGSKVLEIKCKIRYKGITHEQYSSSYEGRYNRINNSFWNIVGSSN